MSKESTESASRDKSNVLVKGSTHLTLCTPDSGTGSVLERAIEGYIEQVPQQLKILREALTTGNAESLANVAQILKSASATLGALGNSTRCTALEQAGGKNAQDSANITLKENHDDMPREGEVPLDVVGAGQHIWLVDDDASFQEATATALRSSGFQVTITENGDQVLSMSHHSRPDLVLLGAIMEGLDGFEVCRQLNQRWQGWDIPILLVTGLDDLESVTRAFAAGAAGFIVKPLNYALLIHRILFQLRASGNQRLLRENHEYLTVAQRMVGLGFWRWNATTDQISVSCELAELCGTTPEEFGSGIEALLQRIHVDDLEHIRQEILQMRTHITMRSMSFRFNGLQDAEMFVDQQLASPSPGIILGTILDVTKQKKTEEKISQLAYNDVLTGLANRTQFQIRLDSTMRRAERRKERFALLFLDLDGFKNINDRFGHGAGDELLKIVGKRLRIVLREVDFAARLGGDEFCLIIEGTADEFAAADVATRCLKAISEPLQLGKQTIRPHVSIGITLFPDDGQDQESLLRSVDRAMYAAKHAGKHQYAFYSPELTYLAEQRLALEHDLRHAIEQEEFVLHYQPQICLTSGKIIAVEAFLCWQHPDRGLVPPDEFIKVAERIGMQSELGEWVLHTALRQAGAWRQAGVPPVRMAVNISNTHFRQKDIGSTVKSLLERTELEPSALELEVSESVVQEIGRSKETFSQLKELGVTITLDEFGSGYSSLGSLKHLPIDCLKINRIFIEDVLTERSDSAIVATVIAMGQLLNLSVIADGVETIEQVKYLFGIGCHSAQGLYFSGPVPADGIQELMKVNFL
ncbi:MAG: EAL domain-containing protein [Desulfocapsa sp.]|uniref:EAL domain-containing protein n=1 Tax=Desulfotalea psychrophila TaxID=84980 RepID=A0ABS3AUI9_9BACT|nr:EAL domain-containing protein [Desulfocapsa sp.]MBN4068438.1 EAL domain-containing protein [Desulfotalea psychrophila]